MNQVDQLIKLTKKFLTKYDYENVISTCDKILELDSSNNWGLQFKGISYFQTENYEKGLKYYEKLNKLYPNNQDTIFSLADLYIKLGKYEEALKCYDEIIDVYPVERLRHRLLSQMNRYDFLIEECEDKLSLLKPEGYGNNKIMGLLEEKAVFLYKNKQYDEAYSTFKKVLEIYPEAKKGLNPYKKDPSWYTHLEECLNNNDNSEDFFNEFFKVENHWMWYAKVQHGYAAVDSYVYADILLEKNPNNIDILELYARDSQYSDIDFSIDYYHKILELDPENKGAANMIISLYKKEYCKDKALKFIESRLNSSSLHLHLLKQKINLLESMTLYEEALKTYDEYIRYVKIDETSYEQIIFDKLMCMELYALELYNEKRYEKAYNILKEVSTKFQNIQGNYEHELFDWYDKVLKESLIKSNNDSDKFFKLFYNPDKEQTDCWIEKMKFEEYKYDPLKNMEYEIYYDVLCGVNSHNYKLLLSKARTYYTGIKKPQEAIPIFNKILEINPNDQEILNEKFNMLCVSKEYEEAYNLLKIIKINYPKIHYHLEEIVDIFINNNKYDEAKYCLNRMLIERWTRKDLKKLKLVWDKSNDVESQKESLYYMDWINLINFKHNECICPECQETLIPIKYGLIIADKDLKYKSHRCHASEKINFQKYRPTDYCPKCKKELYMGLCGIDFTEDDYKLVDYTKDILIWTIEYLETNLGSTIEDMEKEIYTEFSLNHQEFQTYIDKLREIEFIVNKNEELNLCKGYDKFRYSIKQKYNGKTHIFKNKEEFNSYVKTCSEFKDYDNFEEFLEDIKLCLVSYDKETYEEATDIIKREKDDLQDDLGKFTASFVADEIYWDYHFVG